MKLQLLLTGQFPACLEARDTWQQVCQESGLRLEVIELEEQQGRQLADELGLKSFPVLLVDGRVKAVGRPSYREAVAILEQLPLP